MKNNTGGSLELHLDPVTGSEQGGRSPCVIIKGNLLNQYLQEGNLVIKPNSEKGLQKNLKF